MSNILKSLFAIVLILTAAGTSWSWQGKVIAVADGDTMTVLTNSNEQVRIRLYGIDTPEKAQSFGTKAKQALAEMTFGKQVEILPVVKDRYGRTVAHVLIDREEVNGRMIEDGWAWVYQQYCKEAVCTQWSAWEAEARSLGAGLWADPNPTPPWEWRHGGEAKQPITRETAAGNEYHGNTKSRVFHRHGCPHFDCKNCQAVFNSHEEAINAGFKPCGVCRP